MHLSRVDQVMWGLGDLGLVTVLAILLVRRLQREFPIFTTYLIYGIASDVALYFSTFHPQQLSYFTVYFTLNGIQTLLGFGVLFEIGAQVLRPVTRKLPAGALGFISVLLLIGGLATWILSGHVSQEGLTVAGRAYVRANTISAILSVVCFAAIALFAQVFGIGWKNHVLQLATGLAFYSAISLIVEIAMNHLIPDSSNASDYASRYRSLDQLRTISYLGALGFWAWSFAKKEAPRKEFSPQMATFLVSIAETAKRNRAAFVRPGHK